MLEVARERAGKQNYIYIYIYSINKKAFVCLCVCVCVCLWACHPFRWSSNQTKRRCWVFSLSLFFFLSFFPSLTNPLHVRERKRKRERRGKQLWQYKCKSIHIRIHMYVFIYKELVMLLFRTPKDTTTKKKSVRKLFELPLKRYDVAILSFFLRLLQQLPFAFLSRSELCFFSLAIVL